MPSSTFRAWAVGLFWTVLISGVNQFFFFRYPTITISPVCVLSAEFLYFTFAESNHAQKDCRLGVDFPHLQSLGSICADYFPLRTPN